MAVITLKNDWFSAPDVVRFASMSGAHVFIDRSQFPENVRRDLIESLRARSINHKFHYESYKQAAKWLALHAAYSPARRDESCLRIYDEAFAAVCARVTDPNVHVVGLACGGGQKEARLLQLLHDRSRIPIYTASDVSLPLVLVASEAVNAYVPDEQAHRVVCDLATTKGLSSTLDSFDSQAPRIVTLFGVIPNFQPALLLSAVAPLLRANDHLLISANLAPGADYASGVQKVLPQYDNELTREWLLTLLLDLGVERGDGVFRFAIETDEGFLRRVTAHFEFACSREVSVLGQRFQFARGESVRVFFSYRHTTDTMRSLLAEHELQVVGQWLNDSGEEAVFLCRRLGSGVS